ncbi:MAG: YibE/F family protein [Butyrivibrio sp.]|nr:YibE/F family protein [Butyrivibrio sp.]
MDKIQLISRQGQTFEKAQVIRILSDNMQEDGTRVGQQSVMVRMLSGSHKGEDIQTTSSAGFLFGAACRPGMHVIVMQSVSGDAVVTSVYAQDRSMAIYFFALLYLGVLCLVGGKKGLKGAIGLVFTFFTVIFLDLPLIYRGFSPFLAAVIACCITTVVTMYLIGGASRKTIVATVGTISGVIIAGIAARIYGYATGLSGWNVSDIENLLTLWETSDIQVGGLLFAGLLIASLGATMDVAMSIASAMQEIVMQNPLISRKELWTSGMRVGRDMMGTDSNTLILAFAGTSISTLVLDYAYDLPYLQVINSNNIGLQIMQGLSGSFGIVLSVPVTVFVGVLLYCRENKAEQEVVTDKALQTAFLQAKELE